MAPERSEPPGDAADVSTQTAGPTDLGHVGRHSTPVDHGQFTPGAVLDHRYRIVSLVGRGGMGEVYRADDLRLGQTVALKFLPKATEHDAGRWHRLHEEVRVAREVAHPNVCRVYDINDHDGRVFLSMEFVGGEDLAASLRRLGRPPDGRAIEIAREICAGLSAAHARGVIHRDLKPSNIMLDDHGRIRLMDFGLAVFAAESRDLAGTPAYMAPEQVRGEAATTASDIYALGLVLYELFVGRRAISAASIAERRHGPEDPITPPTDIVGTLDPQIEHAILLCLEVRPDRRPVSAAAVAALLERADPMARLDGAGETPSPEMLAMVGHVDRAVSAREGIAWMAALLLGVLAGNWASQEAAVAGQLAGQKPLAVLWEEAHRVTVLSGLGNARFVARGVAYDRTLVARGVTYPLPVRRQLPTVTFWMHAGDTPLQLPGPFDQPGDGAPAPAAGAATVELDVTGRLVRFTRGGATLASPVLPVSIDPDWRPWFAAARLDPAQFPGPTSIRLPSSEEIRVSWQRALPSNGTEPTRVDAWIGHGVIKRFAVEGPWTSLDSAPSSSHAAAGMVSAVISAALVIVALALAAWNIRRARADRDGLVRVAIAAFTLVIVGWIAGPGHSTDIVAEGTRLYHALGYALLSAAVIGGAYVGCEPFVRRYWPRALLGWSRLVRGRVTDPLVGRDVLVGLTLGTSGALALFAYQLVPRALGWPEPAGWLAPLPAVDGLWPELAVLTRNANWSIINGFFGLFILTASRHVAGRLAPAVVISVVVFALLGDPATTIDLGRPWQTLALGMATVPIVVALVRWGLLAGVAAAFCTNAMTNAVFTLDRAHTLSGAGVLQAGAIVLIGVLGWRIALGRVSLRRDGPPQAWRGV